MAWLCLGMIIICFFLVLNLPFIMESQIKKRLPPFLNPADVEFDVQKLGLSHAFISNIRISKAISIDSINIDYDIKGLSKIDPIKVTLSGLTLYTDLDENNQIKIKGLEFLGDSKDKTGNLGDMTFLSFLPDKIVLQNAKIVLHAKNDEFLIPFDLVSTIDSSKGKIFAKTMLHPFGETINTHVAYDLNKGIESLRVDGKSFDLRHLNPFIPKKIKGLELKGLVDFHLETRSPEKEWKLNLSRIGFVHPFEIAIQDLSTTFLLDNDNITANGSFGLSHSILPQTQMEYTLTLDLQRNHSFDLKLNNRNPPGYEIAWESIRGSLKKPQLNARFTGTPLKSKGEITLDLNQGRIQYQKDSLVFSNAKIKSNLALDFMDSKKGVSSKLSLAANNIKIKSDLTQISFPVASLVGSFFVDKNKKPFMNMTLKAIKGKITAPEFKTQLAGINIEVPIHYPYTGKRIYGKYFIPLISYKDQYKFSTAGKILQTNAKQFKVTGQVDFLTLPKLKTQFDSIVDFERGLAVSLDYKIDSIKLNRVDIEKFIPQKFQTAEMDVMASAKGKAIFLNHQLKTALRLDIRDGKIFMPDMKLRATGISTIVELNDLMAMESVPGQVLTIDSIEANKVKIQDAKIRFSIEDGKSLLVENIRFNWCDGLVSTESIRLPQKNNAYSLTLYCDRLEMAQLLEQIGAFNAQGMGTLNGRIPMIYSDGNLSFDNGFLFSTPGSGGKVVIENTDSITAGIPMDSPQFAQLDLAREALRSFDYKWAKLIFNTFEDTLYVNMELDGKPSKVLPFEYRKDLGSFIRVDASSPGSRFQGIKLDVNLKLPFNQVMKFGNKLKSILN